MAALFSMTDHELYLVTTLSDDEDYGMIASWIMPATVVIDHPRLIAAFAVESFTVEKIRSSRRFTVQMLAEGQHDLVPRFGLHSGRNKDKFDGLELRRSPGGLALIEGTCGWAECRVLAELDGGDRVVILAELEEQETTAGRDPLRKVACFAKLPLMAVAQLLDKRVRDGVRDAKLIKRFA